MPFSLDFIVAAVLVLLIAASFSVVFGITAGGIRENSLYSARARAVMDAADRQLKACYPSGIALCENGFLYSNVADPRAPLGPNAGNPAGQAGQAGFCLKRVVLQSQSVKTAVFCV